MKFLYFFSIFVGNFCPPARIRIQIKQLKINADPDLKLWMSYDIWRLDFTFCLSAQQFNVPIPYNCNRLNRRSSQQLLRQDQLLRLSDPPGLSSGCCTRTKIPLKIFLPGRNITQSVLFYSVVLQLWRPASVSIVSSDKTRRWDLYLVLIFSISLYSTSFSHIQYSHPSSWRSLSSLHLLIATVTSVGTNRPGLPALQPGLRIRIHFIRIRIQHFRLNTDPDPIRILIQGFNDQKLKKITAGKKTFFDQKLPFTCP
jgi:hypothetical protein